MENNSKARKKTSSVWKFCEPIDNNYARCTMCNHKLSYKSSVTNLRRHFAKKHPHIVIPSTNLGVKSCAEGEDSGSDNERNEIQRAANSVISEFLQPAVEESRPFITRVQSYNHSKQDKSYKRESSPERYDYRRDFKRSKNESETELELFGRSVVMQLKQLPLVHALELQAAITNLICEKRIQALRQSHETNTEDGPLQYLVLATETLNPQNSEVVPTEANEVVNEDSATATSRSND